MFIQITAAVLTGISAVLSLSLFLRLRWPAMILWPLKLYTSALSPVFLLVGALGTFAGLITGSVVVLLLGIYVFGVYYLHMYRITRPPAITGSFGEAFGYHWKSRYLPEHQKYFLSSRSALALPAVPEPRLKQDIAFATIPGSDRQLLCDVWQPHVSIPPSGLALIFFHGSAFYMLDKDLGTRPFFRHLAAQGHVIMDVAYRLAPETDMMGMIHDVKRAIAWMKEHEEQYRIDPERIVLAGGSAGGHLALQAAYTADDPAFTPPDAAGKDMHVRAVVSLYGSCDLTALYYHTNQHLTSRRVPGKPKKKLPSQVPVWIEKRLGKDFHRLGFDKDFESTGALAPLLGGHPDECPETYAYFSPIAHVHGNCPPTYLIHGEHDILAPVAPVRLLHRKLKEQRVPAVLHVLPQTDHAFDMALPGISPAAHTEFYEVERFLAIQGKPAVPSETRSRKRIVYQ